MICNARRMTQQQNSRKLLSNLARDGIARAPLAQTKGSGDSTNEKQRSKSKNKISKSVRYELENALVSLCDVWFEEIKPYLVRNNVKVHVHEAAGGDRDRLPPDAPSCSHLDPGAAFDHRWLLNASCANYCSTQPTVLRAPCRKPRASRLPSPRPRISPSTQNPYRNGIAEPKPRKQHRRKHNCSHPASQPSFVPRLCRTHSIIPNVIHENCTKRNQTPRIGSNLKKCVTDKQCDAFQEKPRMKDKMAQTEKLSNLQLNIDLKKKSSSKTAKRRRAATTSVTSAKKSSNKRLTSPLFQNDLIDIIAEKNDARLRVLFTSPRALNVENPSIMNLMPSPGTVLSKPLQKKPWR